MLQYDQFDIDHGRLENHWFISKERRQRIRSGSIILAVAIFSSTALIFKLTTSESEFETYKHEQVLSNSSTVSSDGITAIKPRRHLKNTNKCVSGKGKVPPLPGKKGVAFTLREEGQRGSWVENLPKVIKLRPYWNYSWGPERIAKQPNHIEFVPMLWGGNDVNKVKDAIKTHIAPQIKKGFVKRVFGFNEPDSINQSNMEVSVALDRWVELGALNVSLVSPSCAAPDKTWMTSFVKSADKSCKRLDWIGVHWYGTDFTSFKKSMIKFHTVYDRPIVVTEFALADWSAKSVAENKISKVATLKFMKDALYWLETQSWIVGYAWFSFKTDDPYGTNSALFTDDGKMTTLGKFYASVRTNRPLGDRNIQ